MSWPNSKEIVFESILLGSISAFSCKGLLSLSKCSNEFSIHFLHENTQIEFMLDLSDLKMIYSNYLSQITFVLKPPAVKKVSDAVPGYVFQLSQNPDDHRFELFFMQYDKSDMDYIKEFFLSVNVEKEKSFMTEQQRHQQPNRVVKNRKKKGDETDGDKSDDYLPNKRSRKVSFSKISAFDLLAKAEGCEKRSLRTRNKDDAICEDLTEKAQLQEAMRRSLENVDQRIIEQINLIDSEVKPQEEVVDPYADVDKQVELFTFKTSVGDIIFRMEDYLCLSKNEYLSDVIIDFYLDYIYKTKMTAEQRQQTYIFGTHFYTLYALSKEYPGWNDHEMAGLNAKEKRYKRVDGLLGDINIFEKDFLVIPLMDHNHWFLAIVCFPNLDGIYTYDNVLVEESKVVSSNDLPKLRTPCILIFDSIKENFSRQNVAIRHIKNFLEQEHAKKYSSLTKRSFVGHSPKVPLQQNNVDCGCFILEFMEKFFVTSPIDDFKFAMDLSDWFVPSMIRKHKRREIADVIIPLVDSKVELPKLQFYGDPVETRKANVADENGNGNENSNGEDKSNKCDQNGTDMETENGNDSNGNNNDECFNNNNDFHCLDSNNVQPNGFSRPIRYEANADDVIFVDDKMDTDVKTENSLINETDSSCFITFCPLEVWKNKGNILGIVQDLISPDKSCVPFEIIKPVDEEINIKSDEKNVELEANKMETEPIKPDNVEITELETQFCDKMETDEASIKDPISLISSQNSQEESIVLSD